MMARRVLLTVGLGLLGVLAAASIGYASYLVSRDEVGLPVTKLEQAPRDVVPTKARTQPRTTSTRTSTGDDRSTVDDRLDRGLIPPTTTGDDNSGRGSGGDDNSGKGSSGSGSDSSGKGSGGGGGDFDDD
jgi:hypothetical protein